MKIAFDGQPVRHREIAGIGTYAANLMPLIMDLLNDDAFILNMYCTKAESADASMQARRYLRDNCRAVLYVSMFRKQRALELLLNYPYFRRFGEDADISHFFNFILPHGAKGKTITTIHDMVYKICPETMNWKSRLMLDLKMPGSARRADKICTVSENSKRDIIRYLKVDPDKIFIAPPAADANIFHANYTKDAIEICKTRYGVTGPYLLFTGTLEPRKNLCRLIEAYAAAFGKIEDRPKLVICGKNGWKYAPIYRQARSSGVEDLVIFTGYVPNEDVAALMNGAAAFVYPSLYEGFGMPPLEAMACGTPVITADNSSLTEVVGSAAVLVDPRSIDELSQAMLAVWKDSDLRIRMRERGFAQCEKFSWEKSAERIIEVYNSLI